MIYRKLSIIVCLLCLCFCWLSGQATAASTSDAVEPIIPDKACSLTISYCSGETAFSGLEVKLYRIAEVSADFRYTLTKPFASSGLFLNGIQSTGEWNVVRATLEAHILAKNIAPDFTAETNDAGKVSFTSLKTGIYLAIVGKAEQGDVRCRFDSALIAVPGLGTDGRWQYDVSVNAKGEMIPPADSEEEIKLKVLKLWRGDEGKNVRPQSIEVEIFCDGVRYKTVTLSEENHWGFSWTVKNDGSNWTVVERNVPEGYTMTVEKKTTAFVLTNAWNPPDPDDPSNPSDPSDPSNPNDPSNPGDPSNPTDPSNPGDPSDPSNPTDPGNHTDPSKPSKPSDPDDPDDPDDSPPTGDTSNILVYVLIMVGAGTMLIVIGSTGKRSRV